MSPTATLDRPDEATDDPAETDAAAVGRGGRDRRFAVVLLLIAILGFAFRVAVIESRPDCPENTLQVSSCFFGANDALIYHQEADLISDGKWFQAPNAINLIDAIGPTRATAYHPPMYPLYLGIVNWLGGDSRDVQRIASAALGAATIVLIGVIAKKLAGRRAGWIAAGLAAIYPAFWINDSVLMSESMFAFVLATMVLLAYRFWEAPTRPRGLLLGLSIGAAVLTRGEAIALIPFVILPLTLGARGIKRDGRVRLMAVAIVGSLLFIGPWTLYNLGRFDETTFLTTGTGGFLHIGNCDKTYYGDDIGYSDDCDRIPQTALEVMDEAQKDAVLRDRAISYIEKNPGRFPLVATARLGRVFGFWDPGGQVENEWRDENRGRAASVANLLAWYVLVPFAVAGAVALYRRRVALSPLLGLVGLSATVMFVHALTRVRTSADIAVVLLATVAIEVLIRRLLHPPEPAEPAEASAAERG